MFKEYRELMMVQLVGSVGSGEDRLRKLLVVVLLTQLVPGSSLAVVLSARRASVTLPRARCTVCSSGAAGSPVPEPPADSSAVGRTRAWLSKWIKFDRESLGKLGVDAFFTYGLVSNLNAGLTISVAWFTFCKSAGLSPLAPGQWPKFLALYAGIYLSFGTLTRPFRMAFSVSLTPLFGRAIRRLQSSLPFAVTNPQLNRTLALVTMSVLGNTVCTCLLIAAGVLLAGFVTGVPVLPPGAVLPFNIPFGPSVPVA